MVLKVSKGGIRSGNSFKRINKSAYQRNYRTHAVIIRNLIMTGDNIERQNFIGDFDLKASRIPYSINKKGRWELPGLIQDKIEEGEFDDLEYPVQVVERHKLIRKSNCISVHSSRNPRTWNSDEKGRNRNVGYLNVNSILNPGRKRRTHRDRIDRVITRRGRAVRFRRQLLGRYDDDNREEEEETPSSVRYEVLYPPSPTSGVNYTRSVRDPYQSDYCPCRRRCSCSSKKSLNKSNKFRSLIKEELEFIEDKEVEEDVSMFGDPFRYSCGSMEARCVVNLPDLLKTKNHYKETRKRKRRKSSQSKSDSEEDANNNKKIIYEKVGPAEEIKGVMSAHEAELNTRINNFDAVVVSLSNKETTAEELRDKYGERYIECVCWPRKFIIDITECVRNNSPILMGKRAKKCPSYVVFTLDKDNKANTSKNSMFKLMLNASSAKYLGGNKIETLFDYMETTIDECIQRTIFYMDTLPELSVESRETHSSVQMHNVQQKSSNVAKCADWTSDTYMPNDDFYLSTYFVEANHKPGKIDLQHEEIREISGLANKLCDICYEFLGEQTPGTALQSCGHWFCDGCWAEYLENRINSASTTLTCPEFDCDNVVDAGTACSILRLRDIIKHAKYCHDNKVERDDVTKWCPNTNCNRVLKINSGDVKVVHCNCGQAFCFNCLGEPHWPSPCDKFTDYVKKLKETGDIGLAPVESLDQVIVNGKTCPHCKKFLEKNGGCPYMACVCGNSFCWGCGRDWSTNIHGNECYKYGYKNEHMTTEVTIEDDRRKSGNKKLKWYNVAVKHRTELHPVKLRLLKTAKSKLVKHLSAFIAKSSKRGIRVQLDFDGNHTSYILEQAKLPEYLNELIALHQELSRVAESTALIMDSHKPPQGFVLRLQYIITRLSAFAEGISKGFLFGPEQNPEELLAMFKKVKSHSLMTLKCLHNTVNKLDL